ncbi:hypothetical protein CANCADRAFT_19630, partial [Tortispora caseinolytica NRRL Y-17796]
QSLEQALQNLQKNPSDEEYRNLLIKYPTCPHIWLHFIQYKLSGNNLKDLPVIFQECLPNVLNVHLYHLYLEFIKKTNDDSSIILKSYDFVISQVGQDVESSPIWNNYLEYIQSLPEDTAWDAQQKVDLLRKVYSKVLKIPVDQIEDIWKNYAKFEEDVNKATARRFISDKSSAYMDARTCLRNLRSQISATGRNSYPIMPDSATSRAVIASLKQNWDKWINYELSNPLNLSDQLAVRSRVLYAYKQMTQSLLFSPEAFFSAANYAQEHELSTDVEKFLSFGRKYNPTSPLLAYKAAEYQEAKSNIDGARSVFRSYIDTLKKAHDDPDNNDTGLRPVDLPLEITAAYAIFMRAEKRMSSIETARSVFTEARKLPYATYHIFVESAYMEFYNDKDSPVPVKVFEMGMRKFSKVIKYVEHYFDFLIATNDAINARALFERTVNNDTIPNGDKKSLYFKFFQYESTYGSVLSNISSLQARILSLFPD